MNPGRPNPADRRGASFAAVAAFCAPAASSSRKSLRDPVTRNDLAFRQPLSLGERHRASSSDIASSGCPCMASCAFDARAHASRRLQHRARPARRSSSGGAARQAHRRGLRARPRREWKSRREQPTDWRDLRAAARRSQCPIDVAARASCCRRPAARRSRARTTAADRCCPPGHSPARRNSAQPRLRRQRQPSHPRRSS